MAINSDYAVVVLENIAKLNEEKIAFVSGKDGHRVHVHRVILAAISNYFARIDEDCEFDIVVDELDEKLLNDLVAYFYSGNIEINFQNAAEYMDFASKYEIKLLQEKCAEFQSGNLFIGNCIDCFIFADKNHLRSLHRSALQMICKEFEDISPNEFQKLDFKNFEKLISTNKNTAREEIIFDRLVEWIKFDEMGRSIHVFDLLKCIRLDFISDKALIEKVDVFCLQHNLLSFTRNECHRRILCPRPLCYYRFDGSRRVFQTIRDQNGDFPISRYNVQLDCWENVSIVRTTFSNSLDRPGCILCPDKFFITKGKGMRMFDLISKTYEKLPEMNEVRRDFNPIMVDRFIYVFGGGSPVALKQCERFDTESKIWQNLKPMHVARCYYTIATVNGYIYVAGGVHPDARNSIECYNPIVDEWTKVAMINSGIVHCLIEWKGYLYAIGSNQNVERYRVIRNEWERLDILGSSEDEILSTILKSVREQRNNHYKQWQIMIKDMNYFDRYLNTSSEFVSLDEFTKKH